MATVSARNRHARELFAPLASTYDRHAALLSFGQDARWRRFLVSQVRVGSGAEVLDVATGTAAVAVELVRRTGCRVVGVDQSPEMLAAARARLVAARVDTQVDLIEARAEELPFPDERFAAVTFTYLLRYVDDPGATLAELVRVAKRGATIAGLEFGLPRFPWRAPWELYVRAGLPLAGRLVSPGWADVGRFLGGSIRDFHARYPLDRLLGLWREAGVADVQARRLSLGGGLVVWGVRS